MKLKELKTRLPRLEAIISSWLIVDGNTTTEQTPRKKSVCNKDRYEQDKEEILKHRRERYRTIHEKDYLNIKVSTGTLLCISIESFL